MRRGFFLCCFWFLRSVSSLFHFLSAFAFASACFCFCFSLSSVVMSSLVIRIRPSIPKPRCGFVVLEPLSAGPCGAGRSSC